jgi:MerR family transcriptional regulator, repressor of the yfmOP operon
MKTKYEALTEPRFQTTTNQIWLTGGEVCQILRISSRTLFTYRATGKLSYSKPKKKIFYKLQDVNALLENNYVKSAELKEGLYNV